MISAGGTHACAVNAAGEAFCWGNGADGRLGNGATVTSTAVRVAAPASGPAIWRVISAGRSHTCGITTVGKAYCWGDGADGRLGNGATANALTPVEVSGNRTWSTISAGAAHTCGVTTDGDAFCWGEREFGRLGNNNATPGDVPAPVAVSGTQKWSSISAGGDHSCGVTTVGQAFCWGEGSDGQLGNGAATDSAVPVPVTTLAGIGRWTSISTGDLHSCGTLTSGFAACWGSDVNGRLGNAAAASSNVPSYIPGSGTTTPISALSAGGAHTCGATPSGAAICFGSGANGRLGNGQTTDSQSAVAVFGLGTGVVAIDAGDAFGCALTSDGLARCWGANAGAQVGDGSLTDRSTSWQVVNYPGA
jgi:alpha-tubulin suppressor-like RCC1 family protein